MHRKSIYLTKLKCPNWTRAGAGEAERYAMAMTSPVRATPSSSLNTHVQFSVPLGVVMHLDQPSWSIRSSSHGLVQSSYLGAYTSLGLSFSAFHVTLLACYFRSRLSQRARSPARSLDFCIAVVFLFSSFALITFPPSLQFCCRLQPGPTSALITNAVNAVLPFHFC